MMATNENRLREGGQNRPRRQHKTSKVKFPNAGYMFVTIPATPCACTTCTFDVNLIPLRPEGSLGKTEYNIVVNEMNSTIKQHILQENGGGRFTSYFVVSVNKVQNNCLWRKFRDREREIASETPTGYVNEKMLFHGTTVADTIVKDGFDKTFAKPTGMFGTGIYFAEHSSKSNQYAYGPLGGNGCQNHKDKNCYTCDRKILLCRVALGRMYELTTASSLEAPPANYHSVSGIPSGRGLKYPEYTIYNVDQAIQTRQRLCRERLLNDVAGQLKYNWLSLYSCGVAAGQPAAEVPYAQPRSAFDICNESYCRCPT